jgi:glyceraldehyde-3-phosphate dehydrogenase (NADP+)
MSTHSVAAPSLLSPPGGGFWSGRWQSGDKWINVTNQEDGTVIGKVLAATPDDVDLAVRGVSAEVRRRAWPLLQRREALEIASRTLRSRSESFAQIVSRESSKPIAAARAEVARAVETLRLSSEQGQSLVGETLPFNDTPRGLGRRGWYTREPVGVVAAITSFNDPLNLVAHKIGPALIAGNGVILKPSEKAPLSAMMLVGLLLESGVPGPMVAVLTGTGREVGQALVGHSSVDLISFTGGYQTGLAISQQAGPKKLLMELGGNGAVLVLEDADLELAATSIVDGAFGNSGQNCLSVQRVLVHSSQSKELKALVQSKTRALSVGPKYAEDTDVGPMIDEESAKRVEEWVNEAVESGARVLIGGDRQGVFYNPTVLEGVPAKSRVLREEVFGPVVSFIEFDQLDDAIGEANNSLFGLQAGVFSSNLDLALAVAERLEVGAVMINDTGDFRIDAMPFGGGKHSGIGREGVRYTVESMTEPKVIAIRSSLLPPPTYADPLGRM